MDLPKTTPEQVNELVRKGNADDIIIGLGRFALFLAQKYQKRYPGEIDDIRNVALLTLVKSVKKFLTLDQRDDNVAAYVSIRIKYAIKRFLIEDHLIVMPAEMVRRNGCRDNEINVIFSYGVYFETLVSKLSRKHYRTQCDVDLRDLIETVLLSLNNYTESKRLLYLRIIGCTDKEIAIDLDRSHTWVTTHRNKILEEILKRL